MNKDRNSEHRRSARAILLSIAACLGLLLGACASTETLPETAPPEFAPVEKTAPTAIDEGPRQYRIGSKDVLSIQVYRREDLTKETPVRDDGTIFIPLAGQVRAEGKTVTELAAELTARLAPFVREPQVDVIVVEHLSKTFSVLGEVRQPGVYPLREDTRLLEGIGLGGGLAETANLTGAYLVRGGIVQPVNFYGLFRRGDVSQNVYLEDKDFVYVPSRAELRVYVLGEVREAGIVQVTEGRLTVMEAIAAAGGFDERTAYKSNVKVIRGGLADPQVMTLDLKDALRGKAIEDVTLEVGDIVFVPASAITKWDRVLGQLLPNFSRIIVDAAAIQSLN